MRDADGAGELCGRGRARAQRASSERARLPYWLDVPYEPRRALDGEVRVDACVVGAGVAGLSCARRLAARGLDTLVLERRTVAAGASGRNGGFLLAGVAAFHNDARERYGAARARAIYARTLEAQEEVYALAAEFGAEDTACAGWGCDCAVSPEKLQHAARAGGGPCAAMASRLELVARELPEALRRTGLAGCLTGHDGALEPARWIRLLARAAE